LNNYCKAGTVIQYSYIIGLYQNAVSKVKSVLQYCCIFMCHV